MWKRYTDTVLNGKYKYRLGSSFSGAFFFLFEGGMRFREYASVLH